MIFIFFTQETKFISALQRLDVRQNTSLQVSILSVDLSALLIDMMNGKRVNPPYRPYSQSNPPKVIFRYGIKLSIRGG